MRKFLPMMLFVAGGLAFGAKADPIAGELSKKEVRSPHVTIEPKQNIADILHVSSSEENEPDIYFDADELTTDENQRTIVATGDVVVKRDQLTLYADKII